MSKQYELSIAAFLLRISALPLFCYTSYEYYILSAAYTYHEEYLIAHIMNISISA